MYILILIHNSFTNANLFTTTCIKTINALLNLSCLILLSFDLAVMVKNIYISELDPPKIFLKDI